MEDRLKKAEALVAGLLTLVVVWLHVLAATSAGGLWRDEANTIGLVTLPTLRDLWNNLQYDSFPLLWLLMLRGYSSAVGPMNDSAFRVLGFFVGVGLVGMLWLNARSFRHSYPLVSLSLLAMSPSLIIWGDSIRAYGFGILLILLTCSLLWRFVERPTRLRFATAAIASVASVHTLYYNSVLLLALCAGAVAVCGVKRAWRTAGHVVLIGAFAWVSMVPYVWVIRRAFDWNAAVRLPDYTFAWFWMKLQETLSPAGYWSLIVWIELLLVTLVAGGLALRSRNPTRLSAREREVVTFGIVTILVGVPAIYFFLDTLSYVTRPWYYLTLLALAGVCIDGVLGSLTKTMTARLARLGGVLVLAGATILPAVRAVRARMTNIDLVASRLQDTARTGDLVVVTDWPTGISFSRYYRGAAHWYTIPPIGPQRVHRFDLVIEQMRLPDQTIPVRGVIGQASAALRAGNRVFVVGSLDTAAAATRLDTLRTDHLLVNPMFHFTYGRQWAAMVGGFLREHADTIAELPMGARLPVRPYERVQLFVVRGWRP